MIAFYRDVLGFKLNDKSWKRLDAGACEVVDVKGRGSDALVARGAKMGKVSSRDGLDPCGRKDPDGNPFSLSNRGT
jgi:catechol 2,3-dioxygenase-like lactoylglutathione lyase family enzyme